MSCSSSSKAKFLDISGSAGAEGFDGVLSML